QRGNRTAAAQKEGVAGVLMGAKPPSQGGPLYWTQVAGRPLGTSLPPHSPRRRASWLEPPSAGSSHSLAQVPSRTPEPGRNSSGSPPRASAAPLVTAVMTTGPRLQRPASAGFWGTPAPKEPGPPPRLPPASSPAHAAVPPA